MAAARGEVNRNAEASAIGTGGAGLGTRPARWALLAVWGLFIINGLLAGTIALANPWAILATVLSLVGAVLLTTPGSTTLSRGRSLVVVGCAVASGLLLVASGDFVGEQWLFNFASYLPALLITRGNLRVGLLGVIAQLLGTGMLLLLVHDAPLQRFIEVLSVPLAAAVVGVLWYLVLSRLVARERAYRSDTARAELQSRLARESAAHMTAELSEICAEAEPLLVLAASGQTLDRAARERSAIVEASIRDRIRSPALQHPRLVDAIARCRERGVSVLVLGDRSEPVGDALAHAVADRLAAFSGDTATIRAFPLGRADALSLLLENGTECHRLTFDASGRLRATRG